MRFELTTHSTRRVEEEDVVFYTVAVTTDRYMWHIQKRFRQIYQFYKSLPKVHRQCICLDRSIISKRNDRDLIHRIKQIRSMLAHLSDTPTLSESPLVTNFIITDIFIQSPSDFEDIVQKMIAKKEIHMKNEIHKETVGKMLSDSRIANYKTTISEMEDFIQTTVAHNKQLTTTISELTARLQDIENSHMEYRCISSVVKAECAELRNILACEKESHQKAVQSNTQLTEELHQMHMGFISLREECDHLKKKLALMEGYSVRYAQPPPRIYSMFHPESSTPTSPYHTTVENNTQPIHPSAPPMIL